MDQKLIETLYSERDRHIDAVDAIDVLLELEETTDNSTPVEDKWHCDLCNRDFETRRGLNRHLDFSPIHAVTS